MKTKNLLLLVWLSFSVFHNAAAAEVDSGRACTFAVDYFSSLGYDNFSVRDIKCISKEGSALYYIVNMNPQGWVLVSAQDGVKPLLGYNPEGEYVYDSEMTNHVQWMDYYTRQIADAIRDNDKPVSAWEYPSRPHNRASGQIIEPLIKVNWNQGRPYNVFCPSDDDGTAVVGCVAVGMAQAMSVAQWPPKPNGTFSYRHDKYGIISIDYDLEDPYDWDKIISGADNKVWVAHLLYHCGVSVAMNYGVDGSGSFTVRVANALVRNFSYSSNTIRYVSRDSYTGDWSKLLLDELEAGRAIVYSGTDTKGGYGHCFNIDGYDGALFHVNWGWGGSNNGYFPIDGLRDVYMKMDYDADHSVVIGVKEPSAAPLDITLSTTELQAGLPAGTPLSKIYVKSEIEGMYNFKITGPYNIVTRKYASVPFKVNFNQELVSTQSLNAGDEYEVIITASTMEGESLKREFVLTVSNDTEVPGIAGEQKQEFYSISGVKINSAETELEPGIYIRVQRQPDGTSKKTKVVIR